MDWNGGLEWTYAWTRSVDRYMTWRRARIYMLPPFATRGGGRNGLSRTMGSSSPHPLLSSSPHLLIPPSSHPLLPSSSCATPPYHPPRVCIYTREVSSSRAVGSAGYEAAAALLRAHNPNDVLGPRCRIESNRIESNRMQCTLYFTVLYYTVLCCTVLYCTVLYCTVMSCHAMSCHVM